MTIPTMDRALELHARLFANKKQYLLYRDEKEELAALLAEYIRVKPYVQHTAACNKYTRIQEDEPQLMPCSCGLDAALNLARQG